MTLEKTDLDGAFGCKNHDPNKQENSLQFRMFEQNLVNSIYQNFYSQ